MYYMMGYYIHSCQKMRYKAEYSPSFLLDPETYVYYSFQEVCKPILDKYEHASFTRGDPLRDKDDVRSQVSKASTGSGIKNGSSAGDDDEDSEPEAASDEDMPEKLPPGFLDPGKIPLDLLISVYVLERGQVVPMVVRALVWQLANVTNLNTLTTQQSKSWKNDANGQKKLREGISALGEAARDTCLCI